MPDKPTNADGYRPEFLSAVRATCLYVATKLGDLMDDIVVIGGLVPSLLIDQESLPGGVSQHVGTMDLDIGLTLAILEEERYVELGQRLRRAGFSPDQNEAGHQTRQRWKIEQVGVKVTVDFLIPPSLPDDRGGKIRNLEADLAAVIVPGLHLAFQDREAIQLSGRTLAGEEASRTIWVCGPGAYVVLKALAFRLRGENKDAYDLFYLLQNYGSGIDDIVSHVQPLLEDADAAKAFEILEQDFLDPGALGPRRVAEFLFGRPDDTIQADVSGFVRQFLRKVR